MEAALSLEKSRKQKACSDLANPLVVGTARAYSDSDLLQARMAVYHVRYRDLTTETQHKNDKV